MLFGLWKCSSLSRTNCQRFLSTSATCYRQQGTKTFKKVMVANRGEIAIRVFRACREMNIRSVAVYAEQDRHSLHRHKADESYLVGKGKEPVAAYLDMADLVRIAKEKNVDAIHPGYGFLSERAEFARMVKEAGIEFIGPSPDVMARMGDKVAARKSAIDAGVRVVPGTDKPITTSDEAVAFAKEHGTPIILKAVAGGGGRGMRRVDSLDQVAEAFTMASREALKNFGDGSMFVEKFLLNPRHIEVQLMGDHHGNVVHLYERDCSVQRRHQKVVEIAPAALLPEKTRDEILKDAIKLAKHVGYQNAGTVEFLLDQQGKHYFIEVNARLQVEHTVTEEITGVDLVRTQIKVAEGTSLPQLGLEQPKISVHGSSIQCRITTENPAMGFQPDAGRLDVYRNSGGMGLRIDGAAYEGALILPYYDSLLFKMIGTSYSQEAAAKKLLSALDECEISGVCTNMPFVRNVLQHKDFLKGTVDTSFIDENPELFKFSRTANAGPKICQYLADVKVNGPQTPLATSLMPARITAAVPHVDNPNANAKGWRDILKKDGPTGLAKAVRNHKGLLITDLTMRDAHQSLLATRVRTQDLLKIAPFAKHNLNGFFSLENWGGATFDASMSFLKECPWERLESLRAAIPNIPFQCLFRSASAMGYSNYPDNVVNDFCKLAVQSGMDIFRVFDSLNYLPNLVVGLEAVGKAGGVVEGTLVYTGDVTKRDAPRYNLQYYLKFVDDLVKAGIHILAVKDMSGILTPEAASLLIGEIRAKHPNLPIHVHSHDSAGIAVATMIAAAKAGADIVDCAIDSMSGMTSHPSVGAVVHSVKNTPLDTGLNPEALSQYNTYWEQTRQLYAPFECTQTMKSGSSDVFQHEIPGGQYTNLQFQAVSLNLADQFEQTKKNYREANLALGDIIKVTPSSKIVGDLAQFMTQNKITTKEELLAKAEDLNFPQSVVDFFMGRIGQPAYGFPKELQKKVLRGKTPMTDRPGLHLKPFDFGARKTELEQKHGRTMSDHDVMSSVMFPAAFDDMVAFREKYGPVDKLPTDVFFVGPAEQREFAVELEDGKTAMVKLLGVGNANTDGYREVYLSYDGQNRSLFVRDKEASKGMKTRPKAVIGNAAHVAAPMKGDIQEIKVKVGDKVEPKQTLFVLSAMKMEMAVDTKTGGVVKEIHVAPKDAVDAGDLVVVVEPK